MRRRRPEPFASEDRALFDPHAGAGGSGASRAVMLLARRLCLTHRLGEADLATAGLASAHPAPPLPGGTLRAVLRAASYIAERRRFAPRRFVIEDVRLAGDRIEALHMPQGLEFRECVIVAGQGGCLHFEDFALQSLHFDRCDFFFTGLTLRDGVVDSDLSLIRGSASQALTLDDLRITQDLVIEKIAPVDRPPDLSLRQARIGGDCRIVACDVADLDFDRVVVAGRCKIREPGAFTRLRFVETEIGGDLDIAANAPDWADAGAIELRDVTAGGAVCIGGVGPGDGLAPAEADARGWLKLRGLLSLHQLRCGLGLRLDRVRLSSREGEIALSDSRVGESVALRDVYAARGVRLVDCVLDGDLTIDAAQAWIETAPGQDGRPPARLAPFRLRLHGDVEVRGAVDVRLWAVTALTGAGAGPAFWTSDDVPPDHRGETLELLFGRGESVGADPRAFRHGRRRFGAARVSGACDSDRAHPLALDLTGAQIAGDVTLGADVAATERVRLDKAQIDGAVRIEAGAWSEAARLTLENATARALLLTGGGTKNDGPVELRLAGAKVDHFDDAALTGSPVRFAVASASGFRFAGLAGRREGAPRWEWLKGVDFDAGIWMCYARGVETNGHRRDSEAVHIDLRRRRRREMSPGFARLFDASLGAIASYGFAPMRALGFFVLLWALSSIVWTLVWRSAPEMDRVQHRDFAMVAIKTADFPISAAASEAEKDAGQTPLPQGYPPFQPVLYALDVMTPFVDLGVASHWAPNRRWRGPPREPVWGMALRGKGDEPAATRGASGAAWGAALWWFKILDTVLGVALLTLWIAGLAGLLRRGEEGG